MNIKNTLLIITLFLFFAGCSTAPAPRQDDLRLDYGLSGLESAQAVLKKQKEAKKTLLPTQAQDAQTQKILEDIQRHDNAFNKQLKQTTSDSTSDLGPAAKAPAQQTKTQKITFDFYNTEILDVIQLFMQLLNANYNIYPGLGGKISLHIEGEFSQEQIVGLLRGMLRMNNIAIVQEENIWNFMPLANVPHAISADGIIFDGNGEPIRGQIIQAFRLRYISTEELLKVLKPYLSKGSMVYQDNKQGLLLVCDFPHVLAKIDKLIPLFDVSVFADVLMETYTLKYAKVDEIIKELNGLAKEFQFSKGGPGTQVSFLGFNRLNKLLVVAKDKQMLEFAGIWISELDRDLPSLLQEEQRENIYVYYAQNSNAKDMVSTLTGLFKKADTKSSNEKSDKVVPLGKQIQEKKQKKDAKEVKDTAPAATSAVKERVRESVSVGAASGELTGEVVFVVDEGTNAIIIRCNGVDYKKVLSVIKKLDIYPRQVLIEVVIAEVTLDDSMSLGVEWQYLFDMGAASASLGISSGLSTSGSGLSYLVENTGKFKALLQTKAEKNRVQILSSPHILSSDNTKATINVGEEVPVVTSELRTNPEGTTNTSVDKTIQYKNVGVILDVTPHINEYGLVRMELSQEVSKTTTKKVEGADSPVFSKRKLTTTLAVNDEQTIVIGGLIEQSKTMNNSGLPGLNRIPILKYLFGYESQKLENKELMLFITPHVIQTPEESGFLSQDFLNRLKFMKQKF